jgi:hypothetical protein
MLGIGHPSARTVPMVGRDVAQQPHLICSSNCSKKTHLTVVPRHLSMAMLHRARSATVLSTAPPSPSRLHSAGWHFRARARHAARLPPSPPRLPPAAGFSSTRTSRSLLHRTCHNLLHQSSELRTTGELYIGELHAPTSLHSQAERRCWAKAHVTNVCFKCFKCFRGMLQVIHMDVAKVD